MKVATAARHASEIHMGQVMCICESCFGNAPARILSARAEVVYEKVCPAHGIHRSVVSTDPEYFAWCRACLGAAERTSTATQPRTAMVILEVIQGCNARCPTCSAASLPGQKGMLSLTQVNAILDRFVKTAPQHDLLMISGGEPTLHPQIIDILKAAHEHGIARVMLVTNGIRIARDPEFVSSLSELGSWLEIYLQFDSLSPDVLRVLRGEDLRDVRITALAHLERHQLATTLVAVVKKGLNDHEIDTVIQAGLAYKCVRGVTFQPLRAVGRTDGFDPAREWTTLSEVRKGVLASGHFLSEDLRPHPCNPERISIGYLSRTSGQAITGAILGPATKSADIPRDVLDCIRESMFFSPLFDAIGFEYEDVFRVCIVSYADRFDFTFEGAAGSCIHFLTREAALVPLESHYLFPTSVDGDGVERLDNRWDPSQDNAHKIVEILPATV